MINVIPGKFPHIGWVDLEQNGVAVELAIMKNDETGLYFIQLSSLDNIDRKRIFKVINNRNAHLYELWDLMSNVTLGNGANALSYFHQMVKILTPTGKIISPNEGQRGLSGVMNLSTPVATTSATSTPVVENVPVSETAPAPTTKRKVTRKAPTTKRKVVKK